MKNKAAIFLIFTAIATSLAHAAASSKPQPPEKSAAKNASRAKFSTSPFDSTSEKLQNNYRGHNILEILQKINPPSEKGEFEKTSEYEARVDHWKESPFFGSLTPTSTLAFEFSEALSPHAIDTQYDADKQELTIRVFLQNKYLEGGRARWLETFSQSKNLGSRVGITRMGIKFKVTDYIDTKVGLAIKDQIGAITTKLHIPSEEAPSIKKNVVGYAIGKIVSPYKVMESQKTNASLDEPFETTTNTWGVWLNLSAILIINRSTGEAITKIEAPFTECKYGVCID